MRTRQQQRRKFGFLIALLIALAGGRHALAAAPVISLVIDTQAQAPAAHGVEKILLSLKSREVNTEKVDSLDAATGQTLIVAGVVGTKGPAEQLLTPADRALLAGPEALVIRKISYHDKPTYLLAGSDARGLMYAALDVADRIRWAADRAAPLSELRETAEKPDTANRGVTMFTMNRTYWESRFYDEAYWTRYLDMLAENRFNSIVVILGYENGGFLAPCYPYFFDMPDYPDVRMIGITADQQKQNLAALNRLVQMSHDRGLNFTIGIWDHIYRGGVQGGGTPNANEPTKHPTPGLVWGMTAENLIPYNKAALSEFLRRVPNIDTIQFRMHDESGLKPREQGPFWNEIFSGLKKQAPNLLIDLRAKGLLDSVIQDAVDGGLNFRISTKYWMEQMGLPFHPTHVNARDQLNRRHGYADLLHYPPQYKMHWQLWNGGTARILLWGDPDFTRRFVGTTHLYDGDGFDIDEPLATKMEGQPHDMKPFDLLAPAYRYYDYEFERYWHYYQVFGRIGYNPNTPPEVWDRAFESRFGKQAGATIASAIHTGSWILPRIIASDYPYGGFPITAGWAEKQHLGTLANFAKDEGSDVQQFESMDAEAQRLIAGGETAKVRPQENSLWFAQTADAINAKIAEAQKQIGDHRNKEFDSSIVDLKILASLAQYHARRIAAGVNYALYSHTKDPAALDAAIAGERSAIQAWRQMVEAAGDVYADDLMMGARSRNLCGHWRDELVSLEKGLKDLENQRSSAEPASTQRAPTCVALDQPPPRPVVVHDPITTAPVGKPLTIAAEVRSPAGIKSVRLRYRNLTQYEDYKTLAMSPTVEPGHYQATVPGDALTAKWDFMYFFEIIDNDGNGAIYPDLNKTTPYIVVHLQR